MGTRSACCLAALAAMAAVCTPACTSGPASGGGGSNGAVLDNATNGNASDDGSASGDGGGSDGNSNGNGGSDVGNDSGDAAGNSNGDGPTDGSDDMSNDGDDGGPEDFCARPGVICTMAGTGFSLFDGDGNDALETSFYFPLDVEFDEQGRPLLLDWNNLRIRRINEDNTIETIMGLDFEDIPTNGALGTQTPLHHPSDIEMDDQFRLLVAGDHVPVVFILDTDDRVYIVAGTDEYGYSGDGGPALEATLTVPFGVLPDGQGGFYVSDTEAYAVRYVGADGIINTIAGNGTRGYSGDGGAATEAQLDNPSRMRLDDAGDLYICDTRNNVIRRVSPDGIITTFAGTGEVGYSGDGGPAIESQLNRPYDVRFSPAGDLYIADTGNNVIRKIDTDGVITTVVGTGEAGYAGDGANAVDAQLDGPSSVTFDEFGALWIADAYNHRVRRVAGFLAMESE